MFRIALIAVFMFASVVMHAQVSQYDLTPWDITKLKNGKYRLKTDQLRIQGHVREQKENGKWIFEKKNHSGEWYVSEERNYWEGELNGRYFSINEYGDTVATGNYHKGKQTGEWRFYRDGALYAKKNFDAQGYPSGEQTILVPDRGVIHRSFYTDTIHCYYWWYDPDGYVTERGEMVRGKKSGTCYEYLIQRDGAQDTLPHVISHWWDGNLHGNKKVYYNGMIVYEYNYYNGMLDSVQRVWNAGQLQTEAYYHRGRLHGPQRSFYPDGKVFAETVYEQNEVVARHQFDTITGTIVLSYWYSHHRTDSVKSFARNGQLVYSECITSVVGPTYEVRRYYESGAKRDSSTRVDAWTTGESRSWHENGKPFVVSHHNKNGYCGTLDVWNEKGIHVVHAMPSEHRDTVPEQVWSDAGQKLKAGTDAYSAQLDAYLPVERYNDSMFYLHRIVVTAHLPSLDGPNSSATAVQMEIGDSVATNKRIAPHFPGGDRMFQRYMMKNIQYPDMLREMGIQGSTWVRFTVNTDSTLSDFVLLKKLAGGPGCDMEAMRALKAMPKWGPAMRNGKAYKSRCVIEFKWVLI